MENPVRRSEFPCFLVKSKLHAWWLREQGLYTYNQEYAVGHRSKALIPVEKLHCLEYLHMPILQSVSRMSSAKKGPANYDHDKWGWVMVAVTFLSWVVIMGNTKALGVLLIPVANDLDSELWLIGWIGVLNALMVLCLGPIVSALCRLFGSRPMMIFGSLLLTAGFILTALSPNVIAMAFFIIGLAGVGSALIAFISFAVMASYFKEKYPLAVALSTLGLPVGVLVYGPVTQVFLDTYGWRGAVMLLGGISFHLVASSALVHRDLSTFSAASTQYQEVVGSNGEENSQDEDGSCRCTTNSSDARWTLPSLSNRLGNRAWVCCESLISAFDFTILADTQFILVTSARCLVAFSYSGTVVYMVSHGQLQGLTEIQASFLPTPFGFATIIAKLVMSSLEQVGIRVSMTFWACFGSCILCASFVLDGFVTPYIGQLLINGSLGVGYGVTLQAIDVIVRFISADDRLVNVLGWQGLCMGITGGLGGLVQGWFYEWTGSFKIALCVYGGVSLLAIPLLLCHDLYVKRRKLSQL